MGSGRERVGLGAAAAGGLALAFAVLLGACLDGVPGAGRGGARGQVVAAGCDEPAPPPVTDRQVRQPPSLAEPAARVSFRDPVFGSCMVRLTDRMADIAPDDRSRGLKNEYSRVQAFNADESLILIRGIAATWYLYDARSLAPLGQLRFEGSVRPRWDAAARSCSTTPTERG
ncbi:MAG: hypothetical protein U0531_13825 [Dehalococcoidia bacterium]